MNRAGKNQPAPAARANRLHRDPRPNGTKHGRAAKHEHRDWGDRHGELKEEKVAPHKDAWTKFLSNEDPGQRTVFDSELEDRVLETEEETLPERISRISADDLEFQMAYNASKSSSDAECELLTILTYAPQVQFVTATVKRAKALPYNNVLPPNHPRHPCPPPSVPHPMFDHDTSGQPLSVGHCVIGRMGDITGHAHWIQMLRKNGLPVCMWHRIGVN
ncbi:hypothetical protein ANCCAN_26711 [Ancylostoma caninum]|uniref:Uncharacterized protein n=1 Tax=Ancylostoma caninum TaxID=29170 RepID=A0A368F5Y4_ANCCA|nr:hypothetical protein ANCCAN_26711 [Ancylostoma caninum]